jgi:hypothetical protein
MSTARLRELGADAPYLDACKQRPDASSSSEGLGPANPADQTSDLADMREICRRFEG